MSEHGKPATKSPDDPAFKLPASLSALSLPLCIAGVIVLLIGWALGSFAVGAKFGMSAYLTAFMYCLTIALGCLFFVLIQHLCRAGWSTVVRRIAELVMVMVIPLAVLFLPIVATLVGWRWDSVQLGPNGFCGSQSSARGRVAREVPLAEPELVYVASDHLLCRLGGAGRLTSSAAASSRTKRARKRSPIGCSIGAGRR